MKLFDFFSHISRTLTVATPLIRTGRYKRIWDLKNTNIKKPLVDEDKLDI